jgi:hypothetical protein
MIYQCYNCLGQRSGETTKTHKDRKVLTITYEAGCYMRLESKGSGWKLLARRCKKETKA